ncbi:MAG: WbqC family protein [Planctomycetes bacterium]|nr:WbqC family protein [Planctomycetota bacterium]
MNVPIRLVSAHQANYLPYTGFFEKVLAADHFILVDDTQFVKRGSFGWIHRNRILGANGPMWLTLPVKTHQRYSQNIGEVELDGDAWRRKHWRSLEHSYRNAPFFSEVAPFFKETYSREWTHLLPLSRHLIQGTLDLLGVTTPLAMSSELGLQGHGSDYVLELARKTGASHYLSGMHGRDYLNVGDFAEAGIGLVFQEFRCPEYPQGKEGASFIPNLSIVDALFSVGPRGTRELLERGREAVRP